MKKFTLSLAAVGALSLVLTGCGGGGGGGGSSSSLSFPSNAKAVEVKSQETADEVVEAAFDDSGNISNSIFQVGDKSTLSIKTITEKVSNPIKNFDFDETYALNETYKNSHDCSGGGDFSYEVKDSGSSMTASIKYNKCNMEGVTMNGTLKYSASGYNDTADEYTTMTMSFSKDMTMSGMGEEIKIHGGSSIKVESTLSGYSVTDEKSTATMIVETSEGKFGAKDLVIKTDASNYDYPYYYVSGKLYINDLNGYITVDENYNGSTTPFEVFSSGNYGVGKFVGDGDSAITITQLNSSASEFSVEVDTDNDGNPDNTFTVNY